MHRLRPLFTRRLLQECGSGWALGGWERSLSLSCPSLLSSGSDRAPPPPPAGDDPPGDGGNSGSPAYNSISEILQVTTKSREEEWADKRATNDLSTVRGEKEAAPKEGGASSAPPPNPSVVLNYASGPGGTSKSGVIMGIETSCDDTGVAVVNTEGKVMGDALNSQLQIHLNHGGIIPPVAKHLHEQHISRIIREAMEQAKVTVRDLDAVATTVKPGLSLSLLVGMKHGKQLCRDGNIPFIPIHHMKAHALTCRMFQEVRFPYLVLLISGGHCLLAIAKSIDTFEILGTTIDDAPGEAFDKTARRLKLHNLAEGSSLAGGAAIEYYAKRGNPEAFKFPTPMYKYRDCNWSFAGLKFIALRHILREERAHGCDGPDVIPTYADMCASFQYSVVSHLCKKVQRGMIYADMKHLIPEGNRVLVVSGGVACNDYVKRGLDLICQELNYKLLIPSKHLCVDNGVMIAWNGVEKWRAGIDLIQPSNLDSVDIEPKSPMGISLHEEIRHMNIKCKRIKMTQLFQKEKEGPANEGVASGSGGTQTASV